MSASTSRASTVARARTVLKTSSRRGGADASTSRRAPRPSTSLHAVIAANEGAETYSATLHTKRERVVDVVVTRDAASASFVVRATLRERAASRKRLRRGTSDGDDVVLLHFGLTRESAREWMCLEDLPVGGTYDDATGAMRLPFDAATATAEIFIPEYIAPASLDFVLYDPTRDAYDEPSGGWGGSAFSVPLGIGCGHARELGATVTTHDVETKRGAFNISVLSRYATAVSLVLQWRENTMELALNPISHRTGNVWHIEVPYGGEGDVLHAPTRDDDVLYGFRCEGDPEGRGGSRFFPAQVLFDPRAIELKAPLSEMEEPTPTPRFLGSLAAALERRIVGESSSGRQQRNQQQVVAFDVDVSTFTREGTLRAAASALEERRLTTAFNVVALAPLLARCADGRPDAPVSFFAIDPMFGTRADLREFVRRMNAVGVEVWMRCVLTQTGEGTDASPRSESLRGIDAASYFQLGASGGLEPAGVPMTTALNPCSAPTIALLTDALRSFALYEGVSSFIIESGGGIVRGPLGRSPLLEKLAHDAVLGNAAQTLWLTPSENECGAMPSWGIIGERNSKFTPSMMRFFQGQSGALGDMALRLGGSPDVFNGLRDARYGLNALEFAPPKSFIPSAVPGQPPTPTRDAASLASLAAAFTSNGGVLMDIKTLDDPTLGPLASKLAEFRTRRADIFANDDAAYDTMTWIDPFTGATPDWDAAAAAPVLACVRHAPKTPPPPPPPSSSSSTLHPTASPPSTTTSTAIAIGDVFVAYNGSDVGVSVALPTPPAGASWTPTLVASNLHPTSAPHAVGGPSTTHHVPSRAVAILELTQY